MGLIIKVLAIRDILLTTKRVNLIIKREYIVIAYNPKHEAFVIYIAVFNISFDSDNKVHPSKKAQITHLKADEAPTKVPSKYADFADVFSPRLTAKLSKYMSINNHAIELVDDQQPLYGSIYNLDPVKLETLKVYIKNNLANEFIRPSKSVIGAFIFFDKKLDRKLRLCVNY